MLTTPEIVRRLTPSVVQVAAALSGGGQSIGTGIVYDNLGHILTNWHVVEGAQSISIGLVDGSVVDGALFRDDPTLDLAIIKVDRTDLPPAPLGESGNLEVGEDVVAIGQALGLPGGPTVSKGVVSALNRTIIGSAGEELTGLIQTDAAINSGNSGGPLVDSHGLVIGINTAKITSGEGIGFAINIDTARETANRLIAAGPQPPAGYLGVAGEDITPAMSSALGLPVARGFGVTFVGPGTPAESAGLQRSDVIVQLNSTPITSGADVTAFLHETPSGTKVQVFVWRATSSGWVPQVLNAVLGDRP